MNVTREIHKHKNNPLGKPCTNPVCIARGHQAESHDIMHCWQKGGGMEGQWPEWMILHEYTSNQLASTASDSVPMTALASNAVKLPELTLKADLSCMSFHEYTFLAQQ